MRGRRSQRVKGCHAHSSDMSLETDETRLRPTYTSHVHSHGHPGTTPPLTVLGVMLLSGAATTSVAGDLLGAGGQQPTTAAQQVAAAAVVVVAVLVGGGVGGGGGLVAGVRQQLAVLEGDGVQVLAPLQQGRTDGGAGLRGR